MKQQKNRTTPSNAESESLLPADRHKRAQDALARLDQDLAAIDATIAQAEHRIAELSRTRQVAEGRIVALKAQGNEIISQSAYWRAQVLINLGMTTARAKVDQLEADQQALEAGIRDAEALLAAIPGDLATAQEQRSAALAKRHETTAIMDVLRNELHAARQALANERMAAIRATYADRQALLTASMADLLALHDATAQDLAAAFPELVDTFEALHAETFAAVEAAGQPAPASDTRDHLRTAWDEQIVALEAQSGSLRAELHDLACQRDQAQEAVNARAARIADFQAAAQVAATATLMIGQSTVSEEEQEADAAATALHREQQRAMLALATLDQAIAEKRQALGATAQEAERLRHQVTQVRHLQNRETLQAEMRAAIAALGPLVEKIRAHNASVEVWLGEKFALQGVQPTSIIRSVAGDQLVTFPDLAHSDRPVSAAVGYRVEMAEDLVLLDRSRPL